MTDRELLEMAAKAAGLPVRYVGNGEPNDNGAFFSEPDSLWWNPFEDDGDALRLAVKLGIDVEFEGKVVFADGNFSEFKAEDPNAATRRAIVRAAAAMVAA